jgi:CubicO group peptidase (beta-lactamase class C family)
MVLDYVSKFKPDTFPGVKNEYSNLGMGLLGMILEKIYNLSYEQMTDSFICKPLLMTDTKISLNPEQAKRFASGYTSDGYETPYWGFVALEGAGGLRSTTKDIINYVKANLEETLPCIKLSHQSTFNDGNNNIAMGWHLFTTKKSNEMIWHNGLTGGFSSFCGFIKSKNVGVVVLSNTGNPCDQIALGILKLLQ